MLQALTPAGTAPADRAQPSAWRARTTLDFKAFWLICALGLIEWAWIRLLGWQTRQGMEAITIVAIPFALGILLDALGLARRLATAANLLALWLSWMVLGCLLSYLTAQFALPLRDGTFAALDARLGFDWLGWHRFVESVPALDKLLMVAYLSMIPQIALSCVFLSHEKRWRDGMQLWWATMTAIVITSVISGLLPGLCAWDYHRTAQHLNIHIRDLVAVREGTMGVLPIMSLKSIMTFPSFHAVMAVLLTYPYRHVAAFPLVLAWNGLMLLSVPKHGGHYFVDVLAGVLVAALSIYLVTKLGKAGRTRA